MNRSRDLTESTGTKLALSACRHLSTKQSGHVYSYDLRTYLALLIGISKYYAINLNDTQFLTKIIFFYKLYIFRNTQVS